MYFARLWTGQEVYVTRCIPSTHVSQTNVTVYLWLNNQGVTCRAITHTYAIPIEEPTERLHEWLLALTTL